MYYDSVTAKVLIPLGREKPIDRTTTKYIFGCKKQQPNVHLIEGVSRRSNVHVHLFDFNFGKKGRQVVICYHYLDKFVTLPIYAINTIYTLLHKNRGKNNGALSGAENKMQSNVHVHLVRGSPA